MPHAFHLAHLSLHLLLWYGSCFGRPIQRVPEFAPASVGATASIYHPGTGPRPHYCLHCTALRSGAPVWLESRHPAVSHRLGASATRILVWNERVRFLAGAAASGLATKF